VKIPLGWANIKQAGSNQKQPANPSLDEIARKQAIEEKKRQKIIAEEQAKRAMEAAQKKQAAAAKTPWNKVPVSGKKVQQSGGGQKKSLAEVMKEQQKAKEGKKKPQVAVSQKAQKAPTLKLPGGSQWNQRISQAQAAPTRPAPAPAPKVNKTKGSSPWAKVASFEQSRATTKGWDQEPTLGNANKMRVAKPLPAVKKAPKKNPHQQSKKKVEQLFNQQATKVAKEVNDEYAELKKWFFPKLKELQPKSCAEVLFSSLISLDDVYEIKDQITASFGEGQVMKDFGDEFIKRSGKANKNNWQKANGGKKGKKKNQFKNANMLLGITVGASANRTNMGEIQTPQ